MGDKLDYSALANEAYTAVKELDADEQYKVEGFKIVLSSLVNGGLAPAGATRVHSQGKSQDVPKRPPVAPESDDWAGKIAEALGMTPDQVAEIYYYDGEVLRLLIGRKQLPESASSGTQHIAALLAAGRQAMGLDQDATEFETIKVALKDHNVFNAKNWTAYIKQLGSKFIYSGSGQQQTVKLTNKAFDVAAEIASGYLEAKE